MYLGALKKGSTIEVSFASASTNSGTAHLLVGHGKAGETSVKNAIVAPAGSAELSLKLTGKGLLRIFLDLAGEADRGRLEVKQDGAIVTSNPVKGDTTWVYSVA